MAFRRAPDRPGESDRYAKRRSEDLAESVSGVNEVQNHIRLQADRNAAREG